MSVAELTVYQPVWRCIYCGIAPTRKGALGKEHIIPQGLGGTLILPRASCRSCEDITKRFERECLRKMFREVRGHLNIPAKPRRPKQRPSEFRIGFTEKGKEKARRWLDVPIEAHPFSFSLPGFPAAGILEGRKRDHKATIEKIHTYLGQSFHQKMRHIGANAAFTLFPIGEFFQLLAKIGHAYAVAEIGLSHFSPLLVDLILGRDDHLGHHIGTETKNPGGNTTKLHTLALTSARDANGDELIVVNVRLFARLSAPPYHVVVGRPLA